MIGIVWIQKIEFRIILFGFFDFTLETWSIFSNEKGSFIDDIYSKRNYI